MAPASIHCPNLLRVRIDLYGRCGGAHRRGSKRYKMRMKVCWGVFGVLVGLFVVAVTPLGGLIHLHGDFRDFVVPLGLLGVVLLILAAVTRIRMLLKSFLLGTGASRRWAGQSASISTVF